MDLLQLHGEKAGLELIRCLLGRYAGMPKIGGEGMASQGSYSAKEEALVEKCGRVT